MARREIHNAIVTRNLDDDIPGASLKGAVFFDAPTLFEGEYPDPALPCFQFASRNSAGIFFVPKVGDEIEIEISVDDGTDDTSDVEIDEPRWRCTIYSLGDAELDINKLFKENYPFRMGWVSNTGHHLIFDDKKGSGKVFLGSSAGHELLMDDVKNLISFKHKNGGILKIESSKAEFIDVTGLSKLTLKGGEAILENPVVVKLPSQSVELGDAAVFSVTVAESIVALADLIQVISSLPGSPSTIPIVPMSSKAGTPLDPISLDILMKANI